MYFGCDAYVGTIVLCARNVLGASNHKQFILWNKSSARRPIFADCTKCFNLKLKGRVCSLTQCDRLVGSVPPEDEIRIEFHKKKKKQYEEKQKLAVHMVEISLFSVVFAFRILA